MRFLNWESVSWNVRPDTYRAITPTGVLTMSTYVDNVYVAAKSCYAASAILDDASMFLSAQWNLVFKPSSRLVMAPSGCQDVDVTDDSKWPVVSEMEVLGHRLQNDCGIEFCFRTTCQSAWKAFFANCCCKDASRLPATVKISILKRAVEPVLRFRWTRWPFRKDHARRLETIQKQMLCIVSGIRPDADEEPAQFVRRRGRAVGELQRQMGSWASTWAFALISWMQHLERPRNASLWSAMLKDLRDPTELDVRRAMYSGRPCTRIIPGFMQRRWFESLQLAREWISQRVA